MVTFLMTPLCRVVANHLGVIDHPKGRKTHAHPTPYLGGVAMLAGLAAAVWVAGRLGPIREAVLGTTELRGVLAGAAVIVAVGTLDDAREVSAPARLAGQIVAGSLIYFAGVAIAYFRIPFGDFVVLGRDLAPIATVVWVMLMTNALNWIDGLDGLAAGIAALGSIAFFVFGFWFLRQGVIDPTNMGPLLAAITAGVALGFLPWNWHPARIFMGDGGAYLLGLLVAASTIMVGGRTSDVFPGKTYFFFAPLVVPVIIMGVAVADTGFAVLRRIVNRRAPHEGDLGHLHYRLIRLGHGHRRAVLILYAWTALLSGVVLVPTFLGASNAALPLLVAGVAVGLFTFLRPTGGGDQETADTAAPGRSPARRGLREPAAH